MGGEGPNRSVVACDDCGSVYAARERADGTVFPIGKPEGCSCGGTEFTRVSETSLDGSLADEPVTEEVEGGNE